VAAVRAATDWPEQSHITDLLLRLRTALGRPVGSIGDLAADVEQLVEDQGHVAEVAGQHLAGAAARADIVKALDCDPAEWELAVLQTAALLDEAVRSRLLAGNEMRANAEMVARLREAIGVTDTRVDLVAAVAELTQGFDTYRQHCERMTGELREVGRLQELLGMDASMDLRFCVDDVAYRLDRWQGEWAELQERCRELERLNGWKDQVFGCVAEVLQVEGLELGELVGHVKALRDAAGYYGANLVPVIERQAANEERPSIELAIAGLSIKINGLPVQAAFLGDAS
jgi:hypothetical protein